MSHIFISYSKQNIDFARHLRRLLQDQGFAVWMDETQLGASEKWWSSIEANIIDCSAFIIIMSPASKTSDWVEREILVAEDPDYKKPVFPVLLGGKVWSRLANIQYEDMRTGIDATLTAGFVQRLAKIVPRGNAAVTPPPLPGTVLPTTPAKGGLLAHPNWQGIGAIVGIISVLVAVAIYVASINPPSTPSSAHTLTAAQIAAIPSDTPSPTDTAFPVTDTPTPSNTPIPTIVAQPSTTATVVFDLGVTATEAALLRAAMTQQAINDALIAENTQIAQTVTARAIPTATNMPSATPTQLPTSTQPPSATPIVPTATATVGYPCTAIITGIAGALLNQVRVRPQQNSPLSQPVQQASTVDVLEVPTTDSGKTWYHIRYNADNNQGWISADYIKSSSCPA